MPEDNKEEIKKFEAKYAYMAFLCLPLMIFCSLCVEFNILDLIYLIVIVLFSAYYLYLSIKK